MFEEAARFRVKSRGGYEEVKIWARFEQAYKDNLKVPKNSIQQIKDSKGCAVICDGNFIKAF